MCIRDRTSNSHCEFHKPDVLKIIYCSQLIVNFKTTVLLARCFVISLFRFQKSNWFFLRLNQSSPVVLTIYISHTIVYNVKSYASEILLSDAIVLDMSVAYIKKMLWYMYLIHREKRISVRKKWY